ncbi:MAG: DNA polymerase IV [Phycisphaerales bacterium]|nr:DNA polymerase IV [Phycisphaerales bacterium]
MPKSENIICVWQKCVLHADMDAFFASVEQLDDPTLRGRPILVGGEGGRGVVAAASYEARKFGCHSAMPMALALAKCPHAAVRAPRFDRYSEISQQFMNILRDQSPLVEPISVDEAFVDVTGSQLLLGSGPTIARAIRARVYGELKLTVSVGVATSKFVAKIASDLHKPNGLTIISSEQTRDILAPLAISNMWGVGPKTLPKFINAGIHTFGDLQNLSEEQARARLGESGAQWRQFALGIDEREVITEHDAKSVGQEETFDRNIGDMTLLRAVLQEQCDRVALRLRASAGYAKCVTLKVRLANFDTFSRQQTLNPCTDSTKTIWQAADALLAAWRMESALPLRLIGVSVERIDRMRAEVQPELFPDVAAEVQRKLDSITDAVARKYGPEALHRGVARADSRRNKRDATNDGPRPEAG